MNTYSLGQYIIPGLFLFILIGLIPIYFFVDLKNINLLFKILIILFLIASVILFIITIFISYTRNKRSILNDKDDDKNKSKKYHKDLIEKANIQVKELETLKFQLAKDIMYSMFIDDIENTVYRISEYAKYAASIANKLASYIYNRSEKEITPDFINNASDIFKDAAEINSLVSNIDENFNKIAELKNKGGSVTSYNQARYNNDVNDLQERDVAKKNVKDSFDKSIPLAQEVYKHTTRIGEILGKIINQKQS